MRNSLLSVLAGALTFWSVQAPAQDADTVAQHTLGELLDAGGNRLTKAEVIDAVSGATITVPTKNGGERSVNYGPDGTIGGSGRMLKGSPYSLSGTWNVKDTGEWCTELRTPNQPQSRCAFLFKKVNEYYLSDSDSDRSALVHKRTIKK
jgi:hypothetical protein